MLRQALFATLLLAACGPALSAEGGTIAAPPVPEGLEEAVLAGGCFWCLEKDLDKVAGVVSTTSGYTGGPEQHPTYEDVGYHRTGHYEAVRVLYDPDELAYDRLLEVFWHNIDPGQDNGQFCDKGDQYRSAIFTSDPGELAAARKSKKAVAKELGIEVVTEVLPSAVFWVAEEYHQDFYKKNPAHYQRYRTGCGRDRRLDAIWGAKARH
jgi:peptide-methionine (S)-S-oxide reductase